MTKQETFFYNHAGYSWDPKTENQDQGRRRSAENLAMGEDWYAGQPLEFNTTLDEDEPGTYIAALHHAITGEALQCLGGIDSEPGDAYYLVIRAQLALELQASGWKDEEN